MKPIIITTTILLIMIMIIAMIMLTMIMSAAQHAAGWETLLLINWLESAVAILLKIEFSQEVSGQKDT